MTRAVVIRRALLAVSFAIGLAAMVAADAVLPAGISIFALPAGLIAGGLFWSAVRR